MTYASEFRSINDNSINIFGYIIIVKQFFKRYKTFRDAIVFQLYYFLSPYNIKKSFESRDGRIISSPSNTLSSLILMFSNSSDNNRDLFIIIKNVPTLYIIWDYWSFSDLNFIFLLGYIGILKTLAEVAKTSTMTFCSLGIIEK